MLKAEWAPGKNQYFFVVRWLRWKSIFFLYVYVAHEAAPLNCPLLSFMCSRHFPEYLSSYSSFSEKYTSSTLSTMVLLHNPPTSPPVNWLEQLVKPECISKSAGPIKLFQAWSWHLILMAEYWWKGSWNSALPESWVQPFFGFCVRPHQPSHKCLFNISSRLK